MQVNIHAVLTVSAADDSPLSALHALTVERGFEGVVDEETGTVTITVDLLDATA